MIQSNNNNGIEAIFLLRTGESLDIKRDYFIESLKPLLSRHNVVKSLKSQLWSSNRRWSETADCLQATRFPVKGETPKCSPDLTLIWRSVLP